MFMIFDTETTGLIKNDYLHPIKNLDQMPRVIEIGYVILDAEFNVIKQFEALIKPNGWVVPDEPFWRNNGFTNDMNIINGYDMADVLDVFIDDLNSCEYLVAHNMLFDYRVMCGEMYRYRKTGKRLKKICTLNSARNYFRYNNIKAKYNLTDLHKYFFGVGFDNSHNALADVMATARCLAEMVSKNIPLLSYERTGYRR